MKEKKLNLRKIREIFKFYPEIKLVYFFGSKIKREDGFLSDYDFAVYLEEKDTKKLFEIKIDLINRLTKILKTDEIDLVILNTAESPELKYNIIKDGELIFEQEPYKVLIEPKILNEYFDFRLILFKNNLAKSI